MAEGLGSLQFVLILIGIKAILFDFHLTKRLQNILPVADE